MHRLLTARVVGKEFGQRALAQLRSVGLELLPGGQLVEGGGRRFEGHQPIAYRSEAIVAISDFQLLTKASAPSD